jgi:hypothetical protein
LRYRGGVVPQSEQRDPWVPATVLRDIVREAPADEGLLTDLADVRGALVEDMLPLPKEWGWEKTRWGTPMPNVAAWVRESREGH